MLRYLLLITFLVPVLLGTSYGQETVFQPAFSLSPTGDYVVRGQSSDMPQTPAAAHVGSANWDIPSSIDARSLVASDWLGTRPASPSQLLSLADGRESTFLSNYMVVRGQAPGGGGGGAADAVNPSAPLSQLQFQNVFMPESYGGSGYANQFILQPVIAVNRKPHAYFPYHIIRPTVPILAPTSDPDGPVSDIGGLGDTTYFDLYIHPLKKGVNYAVGPVAVFPTSTDRRLGAGEWQLGPAFAYINAARFKDWTVGFLFEAPFSLESDIYSLSIQPIVTKLLKDEWFVGVGDLNWKLDDQNGNYNIPLSFQLGKVVKAGELPLKIFVQPEYTPAGFTSQPTARYGVKLSVSVLLPGAVFGYNKEKAAERHPKVSQRVGDLRSAASGGVGRPAPSLTSNRDGT